MKTMLKPMLPVLLTFMAMVPVHAEPFPSVGLPTPELIQKLKPQLSLTPEQESRMSAVLREAKEKGAPAEATLRERQKALQEMLRSPSGTADAASDLLVQILEVEGDLKQLHLRTLFALRDMLTPDQRQKALELAASKPVAQQGDLESRVRAKVARLQAAVQSLGEGPTEGMKKRGEPIQAMIQEGNWQAADAALDSLVADAGLDELDKNTGAPDFASYDPGDTAVDALRQRLESVKDRARELVSIPVMRRLMKARDALEQAKASQDATAAGRILTFAEKELTGK